MLKIGGFIFLVVVLGIVFVTIVPRIINRLSRQRVPKLAVDPAGYVREEGAHEKVFYKSYFDFYEVTPSDTLRFIEHIHNQTGFAINSESYPIEKENLFKAAKAVPLAAKEVFGFDLNLDDPDPEKFDSFVNKHLLDQSVSQAPSDSGKTQGSENTTGQDRLEPQVPSEPLLYYALGSYWGEWLVRHHGAQWTLYPPLRVIQSFPDMVGMMSVKCLLPFSHVVKKFGEPKGRYFKTILDSIVLSDRAPSRFLLTSSIADADQASMSRFSVTGQRAIQHVMAGEVSQALPLFVSAVQEDFNDLNLLATAASSAMQAGEWDQAQQWLQEGLKKDPSNAWLHFNLGIIYSNRPGGLDKGIELFEKTLQLDPKYAKAHLAIASCYLEKGEKGKAKTHAEWVDQHAVGPEKQEASILLTQIDSKH